MIVFTMLTFLTTSFILGFLIKMSRAVWSHELPEEEQNGKTSMMDREVAGGWFDTTRLDLEFKFVSFVKNIPRCDSYYEGHPSNASSYVSESEEDIKNEPEIQKEQAIDIFSLNSTK